MNPYQEMGVIGLAIGFVSGMAFMLLMVVVFKLDDKQRRNN